MVKYHGKEATKSNIRRQLASDDEIPNVVVRTYISTYGYTYMCTYIYIYIRMYIKALSVVKYHGDEATKANIRRHLASDDEVPNVVVRLRIDMYVYIHVHIYKFTCIYIRAT